MSKADTPPPAIVLELYKLYVEMTDRISHRRQSANNYFLTINTALISLVIASLVYSRFIEGLSHDVTSGVLIAVSLVGCANCWAWRALIKSYKSLNSAKFKVIHAMEKIIRYRPYFDEWEHLSRGENKQVHQKFTDVEARVPVVLGSGYAVAIVLSLLFAFWGK